MSTQPARNVVALAFAVLIAGCSSEAAAPPADQTAALAAFATVERVFQHPRCSNCHIPGDAPLQFDAQTPHQMGVIRGADGHGAAGLPCSSCHGEANLPAGYGAAAPPGAPNWHLPPPETKMDWIGVPAAELCALIKDGRRNGGKSLEEMFVHVRDDKLVLWGWAPGGERAPVPVPHAELVAAFRTWIDAGAPCPR
jgi:hypothetical protein